MANRTLSTVTAFVLGVPLGVGILVVCSYPPLADSELARYLTHPVEQVSVILLACALSALLTKLVALVSERAAFGRAWLPDTGGKPAPVEAAGHLLDEIEQHHRRATGTLLGRRVVSVLEFV